MIVAYFFILNFLTIFSSIKHKIISNSDNNNLIKRTSVNSLKYVINSSLLQNINELHNDQIVEGIIIDDNILHKTITKHTSYPIINKIEKHMYLNNNRPTYMKNYNIQEKIFNELKFIFYKNTKVYIHIEQLITKTNIFHVGISFKNIRESIRYDLAGINIQYLRFANTDENIIKKTLFWDYSNKTLKEITEYESTLNNRYLLGIYDCRHYVRQLTNWSTSNPTPIWKLNKLV